jgi:NADH-quinone oxidoreductase subunit I
MKRVILEIVGGFKSLLTGMRITLQQFFKKDVTVRYPHESLKMTKRYRGHVVLLRDPETGKSLCVACKSCEKACPSDCIVVEGIKREGEKKKSVTEFELDFTRCSLCGSCVEVCPSDALGFSKDYNLASTTKAEFVKIDLVRRMEGEMAADAAHAEPQPESPPVGTPAATDIKPGSEKPVGEEGKA